MSYCAVTLIVYTFSQINLLLKVGSILLLPWVAITMKHWHDHYSISESRWAFLGSALLMIALLLLLLLLSCEYDAFLLANRYTIFRNSYAVRLKCLAHDKWWLGFQHGVLLVLLLQMLRKWLITVVLGEDIATGWPLLARFFDRCRGTHREENVFKIRRTTTIFLRLGNIASVSEEGLVQRRRDFHWCSFLGRAIRYRVRCHKLLVPGISIISLWSNHKVAFGSGIALWNIRGLNISRRRLSGLVATNVVVCVVLDKKDASSCWAEVKSVSSAPFCIHVFEFVTDGELWCTASRRRRPNPSERVRRSWYSCGVSMLQLAKAIESACLAD